MGEVTTLVGVETRYIVISISIPETISAALASLELMLGSVKRHACLFYFQPLKGDSAAVPDFYEIIHRHLEQPRGLLKE